MRRLYDLTCRFKNRDLEVVTTHLDLENDEAKLRTLLFGVIRRHGYAEEVIAECSIVVRERGKGADLLVYVTTEVP